MSLQGYNPYIYTTGFRNQEFHHAVISVSGTVHTLYLDGLQVSQNISGGNVFEHYSSITNAVIGAQPTLAQAFRGTIGDVRMYNYVIPPTTVSSLYRDRNLVVHYPFDTSVNSLTPNYATLVYDASLIGQATINSPSAVGTGALSLANSASGAATQYVKTTPGIPGQAGWKMNAATGITISCWVNVSGVSNRIQRIFDIPLIVGMKGLAVDISGTNMMYSGWMPIVGPIDSLSATAKSNMLYSGTRLQAGAYGVKLLYSAYTGPVMTIRRSSDNATQDFYADGAGNLGTAYLGNGTSLATWLGAAGGTPIAYVTKWYDQTGNGNHGTGAGTTLPFYNTTTKVIDFGSVGHFTLLDGSYPTGNLPYTYLYKQGTIDGSISTTVFHGGGVGAPGQLHSVVLRNDNTMWDAWYAADAYNLNLSTNPVENKVLAITYGGGGNNNTATGKLIYINGSPTDWPNFGANVMRNQPPTFCYLGKTSEGFLTYNSTMPYFYWAPVKLSVSDITTLGAT